MSCRIGTIVNRLIEHPRDYLNVKTVLGSAAVVCIVAEILKEISYQVLNYHQRGKPEIVAVFKKPYEPGLLKEIHQILENGQDRVSILGAWTLFSKDYHGEIRLDQIARRINELSKQLIEISVEERAYGQAISILLYRISEDFHWTNHGEWKSYLHTFSAIIGSFRNKHYQKLFGFDKYGYWTNSPKDVFFSYTRQQYEEWFGSPPKTAPSLKNPDRWIRGIEPSLNDKLPLKHQIIFFGNNLFKNKINFTTS